jgi:hypothetical protein
MERDDRKAIDQHPAGTNTAPTEPLATTSEFICAGCGRPLAITLHSTMCFAEALVYCPDCERDYQQRRGQWAPEASEQRPS